MLLLEMVELNEGQCWEAIQFASHQQLSNLIVLLTITKTIDGFPKDICNPGDFVENSQHLDLNPLESMVQTLEKFMKGLSN